jgi:hypothetical protein
MPQNFRQHHSLAHPAGYTIAAKYQTSDVSLTPLIEKALQDRALLDQLCDRVYQLMLADLQQQQDRSRNYGGW